MISTVSSPINPQTCWNHVFPFCTSLKLLPLRSPHDLLIAECQGLFSALSHLAPLCHVTLYHISCFLRRLAPWSFSPVLPPPRSSPVSLLVPLPRPFALALSSQGLCPWHTFSLGESDSSLSLGTTHLRLSLQWISLVQFSLLSFRPK